MIALKRIGAEMAIALAAGVLSWVVAPSHGVLLHWSPEATDPWRAPASGYALVVPVIVFALGRIVTSVVNADTERAQRPLRVDCAAGVALIAFAGLQRIPVLSVPLALAGAFVAGLAVYFATSALSSGSISDAS